MFARIAGVGSYLPGQPVSNVDLIARGIDTSDDWIVSRTGIKSRHLAGVGGTSPMKPVAMRWPQQMRVRKKLT